MRTIGECFIFFIGWICCRMRESSYSNLPFLIHVASPLTAQLPVLAWGQLPLCWRPHPSCIFWQGPLCVFLHYGIVTICGSICLSSLCTTATKLFNVDMNQRFILSLTGQDAEEGVRSSILLSTSSILAYLPLQLHCNCGTGGGNEERKVAQMGGNCTEPEATVLTYIDHWSICVPSLHEAHTSLVIQCRMSGPHCHHHRERFPAKPSPAAPVIIC